MQSAKYTVCGQCVQSLKCKVYTVCGHWARDQSVAVALLQLLQSQQPTVGKQPLPLSHPRDAFWDLDERKSYPKLFKCCSLMSVIWLYPPGARLVTLISNWFIRSPRKNSQLMFCDCRTTAVPPHLYIVGLHERTNQPLPRVTPSLHVWLAASTHNTDLSTTPFLDVSPPLSALIFMQLHSSRTKKTEINIGEVLTTL